MSSKSTMSRLIQKLISLRNHFDKTMTEIEKQHPDWNEKDTRLSVYGRTINVINSVLFSVMFKEEELVNPTWFKKVFSDELTLKEHGYYLANYTSFLRLSYVTILFSAFEVFFRDILRVVYPNYSKNDKIGTIIQFILNDNDLSKYCHVFDILRILRNSLHNGGIYNERKGKTIFYTGKQYVFKKNQIISVNWELLIEIIFDVESCLAQLICSEKISSKSEIRDFTD